MGYGYEIFIEGLIELGADLKINIEEEMRPLKHGYFRGKQQLLEPGCVYSNRSRPYSPEGEPGDGFY
jgi:hypothetical protein